MKTITRIAALLCLRKQAKALRPQLYNLAWSWCHDAQRADDLAQETLLRGMERIDQLRDPNQLKFWLCRIMSNLHKDELRSRKDVVDPDELALRAESDPETDLGRIERIAQVRSAIARLSHDQRKVLTLIDLMEFSYAEVAQILDIPVGTVMSRLNRARQRLRMLMANQRRDGPITHLRRVK